MKTDRIPYHLYTQAFEKAKWILTNKNSGEVTEYDYSGMSSIVIDAYKSHNSRYKNPTVRYLQRVSCVIYREGYVEGVTYSQILPDYTIECYDWIYQCNHCGFVLDEIRRKGQAGVNRLYCVSCRKGSEYK